MPKNMLPEVLTLDHKSSVRTSWVCQLWASTEWEPINYLLPKDIEVGLVGQAWNEIVSVQNPSCLTNFGQIAYLSKAPIPHLQYGNNKIFTWWQYCRLLYTKYLTLIDVGNYYWRRKKKNYVINHSLSPPLPSTLHFTSQMNNRCPLMGGF